jgi:hypothetical protein
MISVKGKIKNGVALPLEPVKEFQEGRNIIITFLDDETEDFTPKQTSKKSLEDLIAECTVEMESSNVGREKFLRALSKVPKVEPDEEDRLDS